MSGAARWAALGAGLALAWLGLRWFERANLYFPSRDFVFHPGTMGLAYSEVELRAADGVRLHAWAVPAGLGVHDALPAGNAGLWLVFFHGNGGNISHRVDKLKLLHDLGLSVLLFDYRGYGRSAGSPSELGTYLDGEAAAAWLDGQGVAPERRVYYGESLGCAVALETALRRPPRALVLDSPFTSTVAMGERVFPFLPVRRLVRYRYDNLAKAAGLKSPLLVLHSPDDDIIPFAMGQRLFAAAPEPKRFVRTRGDHNEGFLETPYWAPSIGEWLARPGAASSGSSSP